MKNYLLFTALSVLLSGCLVVKSHTGSTPETIAKGVKTVENSKAVTRTTTRGSLLCEHAPGCPEMAIDWKQNRGAYDISMHIYGPDRIDMKAFTFIVDGGHYSYSTQSATSYRSLENSNVLESANTVRVPSSLFSRFKNAQNIQVQINTNQKDISYAMLSNGKQSKAYQLFLRAY